MLKKLRRTKNTPNAAELSKTVHIEKRYVKEVMGREPPALAIPGGNGSKWFGVSKSFAGVPRRSRSNAAFVSKKPRLKTTNRKQELNNGYRRKENKTENSPKRTFARANVEFHLEASTPELQNCSSRLIYKGPIVLLHHETGRLTML